MSRQRCSGRNSAFPVLGKDLSSAWSHRRNHRVLKVHHPCHAPPADRRETQDRKGETLCRGDRGQQVLGPGTRGGGGRSHRKGSCSLLGPACSELPGPAPLMGESEPRVLSSSPPRQVPPGTFLGKTILSQVTLDQRVMRDRSSIKINKATAHVQSSTGIRGQR